MMVAGVGGSTFKAELARMAPMTDAGPRWFTESCRSVDDPFGIQEAA